MASNEQPPDRAAWLGAAALCVLLAVNGLRASDVNTLAAMPWYVNASVLAGAGVALSQVFKRGRGWGWGLFWLAVCFGLIGTETYAVGWIHQPLSRVLEEAAEIAAALGAYRNARQPRGQQNQLPS